MLRGFPAAETQKKIAIIIKDWERYEWEGGGIRGEPAHATGGDVIVMYPR